MKYPSYYLEVVRVLYEADGWIDPYVFHESASLSPTQVAETIADLLARELINTTSSFSKIRMAPLGYVWTDLHAKDLFLRPRAAGEWRSAPMTVSENSYVPSPSALEIDFLTSLGRWAMSE
jgi:hypothetical protein